MEQIKQKQVSNEQTKSLSLTSDSTTLVTNYGNLVNFMTTFNPDIQYEIQQDKEDCYFGRYPTLARLNKEYCNTASVQWLNIQIYNLNEYCGCKDKMTQQQILDCARTISGMYYFLKVSELMLFFFRFKAGFYGKFFGSVDPMVITTALSQFCKERGEANAKHDNEIRMKHIKEFRKNAISYEEWKKSKSNNIKQ